MKYSCQYLHVCLLCPFGYCDTVSRYLQISRIDSSLRLPDSPSLPGLHSPGEMQQLYSVDNQHHHWIHRNPDWILDLQSGPERAESSRNWTPRPISGRKEGPLQKFKSQFKSCANCMDSTAELFIALSWISL